MTSRDDTPPRVFGVVRVARVSRTAGLLLAIPVLLALGVASAVALLVGVVAVLIAPLLRRNVGAREPTPEGDTITLEREAYRSTSGNDESAWAHRASERLPATVARPPRGIDGA